MNLYPVNSSVSSSEKVEFIWGVDVTECWLWTEWGRHGKVDSFRLKHELRIRGEEVRVAAKSRGGSLLSQSCHLERQMRSTEVKNSVLKLGLSKFTGFKTPCCLCVYLRRGRVHMDINWFVDLRGKKQNCNVLREIGGGYVFGHVCLLVGWLVC